MSDELDGELIQYEGRPALRFERILAAPIERVWRALTETDQLRAWHPTPYRLDGRRLAFTGEGPSMADVDAIELDPPHLLVHAWDNGVLRWELAEQDGGCRLVLTHVFEDPGTSARDAAGWHLCLGALEAQLAGEPLARAQFSGDDGAPPPGWEALNARYAARLGSPANG